jgi:HEPN domain-containing protein
MSGDDPGRRIAEARAWLPFVDADLTTVRLTLEANPPVLAVAAYHCQQAAEKLLKSLLVLGALPLWKTHDLDTLVAQAGHAFPEVRDLRGEALGITSWGSRIVTLAQDRRSRSRPLLVTSP